MLALPTTFPTGRVMISAGADRALSERETIPALARHLMGDWGAMDAESWQANDQAVEDNTPILSSYRSESGLPFLIITVPNQKFTLIHLASE